MKKNKNFLSLREILSAENSLELRRIKSKADENAYWTSIFQKVLEHVATEDSQKLFSSIVRIGEIKQDNTTKLSEELTLLVRINSPIAAYKFKVYGPRILRRLNQLGLEVSALQPSVT